MSALSDFQAARQARAARLAALRPANFRAYGDYFNALHFTPFVRWNHALGTVAGFACFAVAAAHGSWALAALGVWLYWLQGLSAHWVVDGCIPESAWDDPVRGTLLAWRMNFWTLTGRFRREQARLLGEYPFLAQVYERPS